MPRTEFGRRLSPAEFSTGSLDSLIVAWLFIFFWVLLRALRGGPDAYKVRITWAPPEL
jgi:hypothetical protein